MAAATIRVNTVDIHVSSSFPFFLTHSVCLYVCISPPPPPTPHRSYYSSKYSRYTCTVHLSSLLLFLLTHSFCLSVCLYLSPHPPPPTSIPICLLHLFLVYILHIQYMYMYMYMYMYIMYSTWCTASRNCRKMGLKSEIWLEAVWLPFWENLWPKASQSFSMSVLNPSIVR